MGTVVDGVGKDGDVHAVALDGEGLYEAVDGSAVIVQAAAGDEAVLINGLGALRQSGDDRAVDGVDHIVAIRGIAGSGQAVVGILHLMQGLHAQRGSGQIGEEVVLDVAQGAGAAGDVRRTGLDGGHGGLAALALQKKHAQEERHVRAELPTITSASAGSSVTLKPNCLT